jgi:hypothetical protein
MKTLDAIYAEYKKERTPELEDMLCHKLERLASIVLKQFRVPKYDDYHEEYLQSAYLLFFELLDSYDSDKGSLDGYYMVSFKWKIIDMMKERGQARREAGVVLSEDIMDESTPYNHALVIDLVDKLKDELDMGELVVFSYVYNGISCAKAIAKHENITQQEVEWMLENIKLKAEEVFFGGGEHIL